MQDFIKLELTAEEAEAMDAQIEEMLAAMKEANEQIARDQAEIEQMQAETRAIITRLQKRRHVETTF